MHAAPHDPSPLLAFDRPAPLALVGAPPAGPPLGPAGPNLTIPGPNHASLGSNDSSQKRRASRAACGFSSHHGSANVQPQTLPLWTTSGPLLDD
ncbi:hypothetical protein F511_31354 [Dorcoceras hygrometricum]|uniref:Uncharacterized protein n=1 Tax=Dorcoceras hygrometricum TaxID=472368 RepID=A0A2Z7AMK3_9LAMI|nr:hypothetical protein F511_31354 [Dorcoceras hygrometricum]